MVNVAINGIGRIGKAVLKICLEKKINVVAVNDLTPIESLVYLLKYDSIYGNYEKKVETGKGFLNIGGRKIKVFNETNPENLPWEELKVDVVIECTGIFTDREGAQKHIRAGAKKVVVSAPVKNSDVTIVLGVNEKDLKREHKIISMASCTTNCLAPIVKVLNDEFGIKKGFMTTVHAYTNDQKILDIAHKKPRRGRAGAVNLIPTSSGATISVSEAIPELRGKIDGLAIRAPIACGSLVDFTAELKKKTSVEEVNRAMKKASEKLKGILQYNSDEIVSSDIIKNPHTSVFDSTLTQVNENLVKVFSWYDNEYSYSCKIVDLIKKLQ